MNKKYLVSVFMISFVTLFFVSQVHAWPDATIYVQTVDKAPTLDGKIGPDEWNTDEEKFSEKVSGLNFDAGGATSVTYDITVIKDDVNIYFLVKFTLDDYTNFIDNVSLGLAFAESGLITGMDQAVERKILYNNATSAETTLYDLHYCELSDCNVSRVSDFRPGKDDITSNGAAQYGTDGDIKFFEISLPLANDPEGTDITIQEGSTFEFVMNPYASLHDVAFAVGHGAVATTDLTITFEPKAFFQRPEGPMDGLAQFFNIIFSFMVILISLIMFLTGINDKIAAKMWKVNITEDMTKRSVLMEIGYYNSSFLTLFSLFFFWLYALIAVLYGWWANWGTPGIIINGPALFISTITMIDLIRRNHNPQALPAEERRDLGVDIEKSGGLWILPPLFLFLVLFMLVFIGIDVIS